MKRRRGKRVTWWVVGLGAVVLLAGAITFQERIREEYYLWRLETGDTEDQAAAAERLAEMASLRALPIMLRRLRGTDLVGGLLAQGDFDGDGNLDVVVSGDLNSTTILTGGVITVSWDPLTQPSGQQFLLDAWREITTRSGRRAIPYLAEVACDRDPDIRYLAALSLGAIGPDARDAVLPLVRSLSMPTKDPASRRPLHTALWALGQIGPEAKASVPALTRLLHGEDRLLRVAAADALKKIQGHPPAETVLPTTANPPATASHKETAEWEALR